ncbi:hypothetical protein [Streptomyces prasinopilosus]|uniref:Secreted protein n=1 Tax=Streptomyces prasinopilosus TaxID=67344 RepID=A0A1G6P6R6_9ACTN|nr:hypothetical protein [Streptomyces prasinopilosus]SDC75833.1 hypothetical protein SAMN05216505_103446 [Streptomyces prasinopilosus]
MNFRTRAARAVFTTSAIAAAAMLFSTQAAVAATDDSFSVGTTGGGCGVVDFVDYGPGHAGGGNNDDYLVIHDYCSDGKGVRAYAWVDGLYLGAKDNTNGLAGSAVIWDPVGNVVPGEAVGIKVCLFNSSGTLSQCNETTRWSVDG